MYLEKGFKAETSILNNFNIKHQLDIFVEIQSFNFLIKSDLVCS